MGKAPDFLSEIHGWKQAKRAALLDAHYTLAQEIFEQARCGVALRWQRPGIMLKMGNTWQNI